jgi:hypothetical protein
MACKVSARDIVVGRANGDPENEDQRRTTDQVLKGLFDLLCCVHLCIFENGRLEIQYQSIFFRPGHADHEAAFSFRE